MNTCERRIFFSWKKIFIIERFLYKDFGDMIIFDKEYEIYWFWYLKL